MPENVEAAYRAIGTMLATHEGAAAQPLAATGTSGTSHLPSTFNASPNGTAAVLASITQAHSHTLAELAETTKPHRARRTDAA